MLYLRLIFSVKKFCEFPNALLMGVFGFEILAGIIFDLFMLLKVWEILQVLE